MFCPAAHTTPKKRAKNSVFYRFGYQGSEKVNEMYGEGNSYTTFFRPYDPRLGRWITKDPIIQPWQSPYVSMDNNPIIFNDPLGDKVRYKDKESRQEARRLRRTNESFREKFRDMKKDRDITYYFDHEKGAGRNMTDAITQELAYLEDHPLQRGPVIEWETQPIGFDREPLSPVNFTPSGAALLTPPIGLPQLPMIQVQQVPIAPPPNINPIIPPPGQNRWFTRNIPFNVSATTVQNQNQAQNQLQQIANGLMNNPGVTLTIFGNASNNTPGLNAGRFAWVNGQAGNFGQLMIGRAQTIANLLIGMGVSPTQIQVRQGQIYTDGRSPNVTFRVNNPTP